MPSKPNILIVGQSGSGKSNSLEKLLTGPRAKEVAVIDLERKGFPFLLDTSKLGYFAEPSDLSKADDAIRTVLANPAIKIVVYDSLSKYLELVREVGKVIKTGWDIWNYYNDKLTKFMEDNKTSQKVIIATVLDEVLTVELPDGGRATRLRAYVQGKQFEGKLEKEFLIVLHCAVRKEAGSIKHHFLPHTDGLTSAKAPQWMGLSDLMPNDVAQVVEKLYEKGVVGDQPVQAANGGAK